MNKICFYIGLLFLALNSFSLDSISQEKNRELFQEKLVLFSDRSIYINGENINLSAFVFHPKVKTKTELGKVFYVELINYEGIKIAKAKYSLKNNSGVGCLSIPESLNSGIYFIKAYTKYMRNWGPLSYYYIPIKIINPLKTKTSIVKNTSLGKQLVATDVEYLKEELPLELLVNKKKFKLREKVDLTLRKIKELRYESIIGVAISVIPKPSISSKILQPDGKKSTKENLHISTISYHPETRGVSFTGKVVNKNLNEKIRNRSINLSIIGDDKIFMSSKTDSLGNYYFSLPKLYGTKDIYICIDREEGVETKILVDNDFCTEPINLPFSKFDLNEEEKKTVFNFIVNKQLKSFYELKSRDDTIAGFKDFFYGEAKEILNIDNFIKLPTLEEYFTELPSSVQIKRKKDKKFFGLHNNSVNSIYPPLVLIDGIAINDARRILVIPPEKLKRIEVINAPYIIGEMNYSGIISIISKNGDFAGVELPKSGMFINYDFLADKNNKTDNKMKLKHHPEVRNTLFWHGDIKLKDKLTNLSFYTADNPGEYIILLRGLLSNGNIFSLTKNIEVGN